MKSLLSFLIVVVLLSSCSLGKVVSSVQINALQLQHVQPTSPSNVSWDPLGTGLGDVQVRVKNMTTGQIIYTSEVYEDASYKNTYLFMKNVPILISDLNVAYRVDIYDIDTFSSDEWMDGFDIRFSDYKDDSKIVLSNNTNAMDVTMLVDWTYMKKKSKRSKNVKS
jgi:hypothetical protein